LKFGSRPKVSRSFIENVAVIRRDFVLVFTISPRVSSISSKIFGRESPSKKSSFVNFVTISALVIFCRFSRIGAKVLFTFMSVISVFFELSYSSNVHRFSVSVAPENLDVGLAAPLAMALIFPCSRVYMKTSLSASPSTFDPRMIPSAFRFLRSCVCVILLLIKVC